MTHRTTVLARTAALASAALLAGSLTSAPAQAQPAQAQPDDRSAAARTTLTFTVDDCEGCEVQLVNARSTLDADVVHVWQSRTKEVQRRRGHLPDPDPPHLGHVGHRGRAVGGPHRLRHHRRVALQRRAASATPSPSTRR